ncbi:hypothetical protein B5S28_g4763 [[Candida] boidinii]|nr:hypothetical protein B5S28_g4763 [[Candida] boidinii]OWB64084.1 hypothetical protein B5S29_g5120 [[Candida] boidinii]
MTLKLEKSQLGNSGFDALINLVSPTKPFNPVYLFIVILIIRLFNGLTIKTFFQADEYWQALEPAHFYIFGNGYLTWEWKQGLRSFLHPLLFSIPYKLCSYYNLNYYYILILPKLLQCVFCSIGEFYLYKLTYKLTQNELISKLTLVLSLISAFNWFCYTRTFSNSLEMVLTIISLYYLPLNKDEILISNKNLKNILISVSLALISIVIRPTSLIIWSILMLNLVINLFLTSKIFIILPMIFITVSILAINFLIDFNFYGNNNGNLIIPMLKFIEFNFTKSLSRFYGVSRLDFYFLQAIPILMLTLLPFLLIGLYNYNKKIYKDLNKLIIVSIIYLIIFSMIQHKEFRFIYPIKPILLIISSMGIIKLSKSINQLNFKLIVILIILINSFLGFYVTQYHESGVIEITRFLRNEITETNSIRDLDLPIEVGFLTPCHSTPFQSHFHLDPSMADIWFLTCEPPLHLQDISELKYYRDESDLFYDDPIKFIDENFPDINSNSKWIDLKIDDNISKYPHNWPDYLVIFQHMESFMIENYIELGKNYIEYKRLFNSRFHWDHRRTGDLIIYKKS